MITPRPLPYPHDALEPYMGAATLRFHHDGHYVRYVRRVNDLTRGRFGTPIDAYEYAVITHDPILRQQAAQVVAHELFFDNMAPPDKTRRTSPLLTHELRRAFAHRFADRWVEAAMSIFGSGWVYLVDAPSGGLAIRPLQGGVLPVEPVVLVMDCWEHAYYLDHPDDRATYSRQWLRHLANWSVASAQLDCLRAA